MFSKYCTLSEESGGNWNIVAEGILQVFYDPDECTTRIIVSNDKNEIVSNTIIDVNTVMEIDNNNCIWSGADWCDDDLKNRKLMATFSLESDAQDFHCSYMEGLNYAQECDAGDVLQDEDYGANY